MENDMFPTEVNDTAGCPVRLEALRYASKCEIDEALLDLGMDGVERSVQVLRLPGQRLAVQLKLQFAGKGEVLTFRVPRTWWDHLKARWFPRWLLRWFPVDFRAITIECRAVFPELKAVPHKVHYLTTARGLEAGEVVNQKESVK